MRYTLVFAPAKGRVGLGAETNRTGASRLLRITESGPCSYRETRDDFFCLRYQVWYSSFDCAWRTQFRTCPGCLECDQGRFNQKRHEVALLPVVRSIARR